MLAAGRLRATNSYADALRGAKLALICVCMPCDESGAIDLKYVRQAAASIGKEIAAREDYICVAVKSTVVPGTTKDLVLPLLQRHSKKRAGADFGVGMTPEFLREGVALDDFLYPDRIVLGGIDARSHAALHELYSGFEGVPKLETSLSEAELIKYVANAYLALHISFANEIALLAERLGVDSARVIEGVRLDQRHSPRLTKDNLASWKKSGRLDARDILMPEILGYLVPNCGYGGSCLPKDVSALAHWAREQGLPPALLSATNKLNKAMPRHLVERMDGLLGGLKGREIAVLGLAFKPGTDDVRESPALRIVPLLVKAGARVRACDPLAEARANFIAKTQDGSGDYGVTDKLAAKIGKQVSYHSALDDALSGADAAALVTPWPEFVAAKPAAMAKLLRKGALYYDGRCILDPAPFAAAGLRFGGIGRG
jgi:UDPglucose 6-dehydrogenase